MAAAIITIKSYDRKLIQATPNGIFVFGDNMVRKGLGGQAASARGEFNAVGIPTKWFPSNDATAYFCDGDYKFAAPIIKGEFEKLKQFRLTLFDIYWPADGIGTGRAQLPTKAPRIYKLIEDEFQALIGMFKK